MQHTVKPTPVTTLVACYHVQATGLQLLTSLTVTIVSQRLDDPQAMRAAPLYITIGIGVASYGALGHVPPSTSS